MFLKGKVTPWCFTQLITNFCEILLWKFLINTDADKFCMIQVFISLVFVCVYVCVCLKCYEYNSGKDNFKVMCYLLAGNTNSGNKLVICIMLMYDFCDSL